MKQFIPFLMFLSFMLAISGCSNKNDYQKLSDYFTKTHGYNIEENTRVVFVITENNCPGCNKGFAQLTDNYLNSDSAVFLITATGGRLDISEYDSTQSNVFFDNRKNQYEYDFCETTSAIFLDENKIDTILNIEAGNINAQFDFIMEKMNGQ